MIHRLLWVYAMPVVALQACSVPASDPATARNAAAERVTPPLPPLPAARDTTATIAELTKRAAQIDRDTLSMESRARSIDLGAGATGDLTAWKRGSDWRRVRLVSEGTTFRNVDTYWRVDGVLIGARLESGRPHQKPRSDIVFFRDGALYYWLAADGRKLNDDSRSTLSEAEMLQKRFADILAVLAADDASLRAPPR
jgi:hypothetical protein